MPDGKVIYEVRADNSKLEGDLNESNSKAQSGASKLGGIAKTAGLAIGGAVIAAGAAAVKFGSEFETAMAGASTLFGDAKVNAEELNQKMLDLSNSSGVAASELGTSLYNALSAGIPATDDMSEALSFLDKNTKLAKAGFTDIDTAASATAKTLNAYKMGVEETDRVHKIMLQTQNKGIVTVGELGSVLAQVTPTAAAMGVSFEQVGAGIANMTAQGTPAAQATTQLNSLFAELGKSGTTASKNLIAAAEGTKYAGMSFQDMMAAGVPLNEVLDLIGGHAAKSNLSMLDMFSSIEAGKAALANSGQNAAAYTDALAAMSTETDVVGDAFDKVTGTSAERFNKILNELQNTAINLFLQMAPLIEELLPFLSDALGQLLPPIVDLARELLPIITGLFQELLPPILDLAKSVMPILIDVFKQLAPVLSEIITKLLPPLVRIIEALLPVLEPILALLTPILDLIVALLDPIAALMDTAIVPLIALLVEVVKVALIPLQNSLNITMSVFKEVLNGITGYVTEQLKRWIDIFQNIIDFIKNVFTGNWKGAWENVKNIFANIAEGIAAAFKLPINFIIDGINGFIRGLNNIQIPDWVPLVGGMSFSMPTIPRLKVGMDYVPSDDFPALLHQGEAVLTAGEANVWRSFGGLSGLERALSAMQTGGGGGINIYTGDWSVREEADIDRIVDKLYAKTQIAKRGRGLF